MNKEKPKTFKRDWKVSHEGTRVLYVAPVIHEEIKRHALRNGMSIRDYAEKMLAVVIQVQDKIDIERIAANGGIDDLAPNNTTRPLSGKDRSRFDEVANSIAERKRRKTKKEPIRKAQ